MLANDSNEWPGHQTINSVCSGCANNEICGPDEGGDDCANRSLSDPVSGLVQDDVIPNQYVNWNSAYLNEVPIDPWGHEYFFDTDYQITVDGEPCNGAGSCIDATVLGSYGEDGIGNNLYNGDDIIKIIIR